MLEGLKARNLQVSHLPTFSLSHLPRFPASKLPSFLICEIMKLRVLFIGNSHTYLHYMPQMLEQLVNAANCELDLEVDQSIGEGASLEWHWNNEPTRYKMRSRNWNYIVLQDRSGGPLEDLNSFQKHARLLDAEIKKHGAATLLYMTWANRNRPETGIVLADAYRRMADELGAYLVPVGLAWAKAAKISSELALHHKDGRHASPIGAYFTACLFYSVLTNANPKGLPTSLFIEGKKRPDQDDAQALLLQEVAWKTVLKSAVGVRK